jgi:hypothetical protein
VLSLSLSRACLGKMIIFSVKMAQRRRVFLPDEDVARGLDRTSLLRFEAIRSNSPP